MAIFVYKALDKNTLTIKGEIAAGDQGEAIRKLSARRLDVFKISEKKTRRDFTFTRRSVGTREYARYIRQLSILLSAGVVLLEAMKSLAKSNSHPFLSAASEKMRQDLRSGKRLSQTMETHLPELPHYVARWAELGEATGQAGKALSDAAERMEYENTLQSEIKTALSYPIFLAVIGGIIILLLFIFVVPRFDALITDREKLPFISRLVIAAGVGLKENLLVCALGFIGLCLAGIFFMRQKGWKEKLRVQFEKIPLVGPLLIQSDLGNWAQTVGVGLDNGSDLLSALRQGEYGVRSQRLRARFQQVYREIKAGKNIDETLAENIREFDALSIDMIRTGRSAGQLSDMLLFIGKMQEDRTREITKRLSAFAEPVAILLIAAIVGTIVISIVLAMTSLYDFAI